MATRRALQHPAGTNLHRLRLFSSPAAGSRSFPPTGAGAGESRACPVLLPAAPRPGALCGAGFSGQPRAEAGRWGAEAGRWGRRLAAEGGGPLPPGAGPAVCRGASRSASPASGRDRAVLPRTYPALPAGPCAAGAAGLLIVGGWGGRALQALSPQLSCASRRSGVQGHAGKGVFGCHPGCHRQPAHLHINLPRL